MTNEKTNETMNPAGSPKIEEVDPEASEERSPFFRFRELTKRLLSVPKSEIDQEREK